jgi:hypothetical protein
MIPKDSQIIWKPHPKQLTAIKSRAFELFYGGAAGGGKTDFLLMDFLKGVNFFGEEWQGILFRQTYPELSSIIRRAQKYYLPLGAVWEKAKKTFRFPNGAQLELRPLEREDDVTKYQGQEYTWVGFDELGNYASDFPWNYMITRTRSAEGAPSFIRGTGNPGGKGHAWLKSRFIDGLIPGKVYKYRAGKRWLTQQFIPSTLDDNPTLIENDPNYEAKLEMQPEFLRRALRYGDWDIFAGQYFDEWRRDRHVVKPFALPNGRWYKFYVLDWGYNCPYAIGKYAANREGKLIQYGEIYGAAKDGWNKGIRKGAREAAGEAWEDAVREGVTEMVADPANWGQNNDAPAPAEYFREAGFIMTKAENPRKDGWLAVHERLKQSDENGEPLLQVFETCYNTIRTIPVMMPSQKDPEDLDSDLEDHLADCIRYAVMSDYARNPQSHLRRANAMNEGARAERYSVMDNWLPKR